VNFGAARLEYKRFIRSSSFSCSPHLRHLRHLRIETPLLSA
jgi:hypothetical protein